MKEVIQCPNCKSPSKRRFVKVPDRHYGIKGVFSYSICAACELVYLDPMPDDDELMAFYPEDSYYSYNVEFAPPEPAWKEAIRKLLFLNYKTKDPEFSNPGKMLDIGCGNGWFIYMMREKGWEVRGVEPSKAGAEAGRSAGKLDIHHGDLISANYPAESFDYVRSNHSFEHIPNPNEVLDEMYRILKPGGKAFIGVPNINSVNGKSFHKFWYYLGAPVHTFNYSDKTLPDMLKRHRFRNIKVNYNSNYSGILGSIQIYLNKDSSRKSHEGFVFNFFPFKILAGLFSKAFDATRRGDCVEVIFEK
ncbi:MAG: class I SAM-dependent methyltransferase [Chryseolinea sp.]